MAQDFESRIKLIIEADPAQAKRMLREMAGELKQLAQAQQEQLKHVQEHNAGLRQYEQALRNVTAAQGRYQEAVLRVEGTTIRLTQLRERLIRTEQQAAKSQERAAKLAQQAADLQAQGSNAAREVAEKAAKAQEKALRLQELTVSLTGRVATATATLNQQLRSQAKNQADVDLQTQRAAQAFAAYGNVVQAARQQIAQAQAQLRAYAAAGQQVTQIQQQATAAEAARSKAQRELTAAVRAGEQAQRNAQRTLLEVAKAEQQAAQAAAQATKARSSGAGFFQQLRRDIVPFTAALYLAQTAWRSFGAVAGFIPNMIRDVGQLANEVRTLTTVTGMSVKEASALDAVFRSVGAVAGGMTFVVNAALGALAKKIAEADQTLLRMNIRLREADGSVRGTLPVLLDLADAYEHAADKNAMLGNMAIVFGEWMTGTMLPVLALGRDGIERFMQTADRLGLTFDEIALNKALAANSGLMLIERSVQMLKVAIVTGLEPALTGLFAFILENMPAITAAFSALAQMVSGFAQGLFAGFGGFGLKEAAGDTKELVNAIKAVNVAGSHQAAVIGDINAKKENLNRQIQEATDRYEDERQALEDVADGHQRNVDGIEKHYDALIELADDAVKQATAALKDLRRELTAATAGDRGLIRGAEAAIRGLRTQILPLQREHRRLGEEIKANDRELQKLQDAYNDLERSVTSKIRLVREAIEGWRKDQERIRRETAALNKPLEESYELQKEFIDDLKDGQQAALEVIQAGVDQARDKIRSLNEEMEAALANLQAMLDQIEQQIEALEETEDEEESQPSGGGGPPSGWLTRAEVDLSGVQAAIERVKELEEQIAAAKKELFELERALARLLSEGISLVPDDEQVENLALVEETARRLLDLNEEMGRNERERAERYHAIVEEIRRLSGMTRGLAAQLEGELRSHEAVLASLTAQLEAIEAATAAEEARLRLKEQQLRLEDELGISELGRLRKELDLLQDEEPIRRRQGESRTEFQRRLRQAELKGKIEQIEEERRLEKAQAEWEKLQAGQAQEELSAQLQERIRQEELAAETIRAKWEEAKEAESDLQERLNALIEEQAQIQADVLDQATALVSAYEAEITAAQEEIRAKQEEINALVKEHEEAVKEVAEAAAEAYSQAAAHASEASTAVAQQRQAGRSAARQAMKDLQKQAKEIRRQMNAVRKSYEAQIKAQEDAITAADKAAKEVSKTWDAAVAQNERQAKATAKEIKQNLDEAQVRIDALELRIEGGETELDRLQGILDDAETRLDNLSAEWEAKNRDLENRRVALEAQIGPLEAQVEDLQTDIQLAQDRIAAIEEQYAPLIEAQEQRIEQLRDSVEALRDEEAALTGPIKEALQGTREQIEGLSRAHRDHIRTLETELRPLKEQYQNLVVTPIEEATQKMVDNIRRIFTGDDPPMVGDPETGLVDTLNQPGAVTVNRWELSGRKAAEAFKKGWEEGTLWHDLGTAIGTAIWEGLKKTGEELFTPQNLMKVLFGVSQLSPQGIGQQFGSGLGRDVQDAIQDGLIDQLSEGLPEEVKKTAQAVGAAHGKQVQIGFLEEVRRYPEKHPEEVRAAYEANLKKQQNPFERALESGESLFKAGVRRWIKGFTSDGLKEADPPDRESFDVYQRRFGEAYAQSLIRSERGLSEDVSATLSSSTEEGVDETAAGLGTSVVADALSGFALSLLDEIDAVLRTQLLEAQEGGLGARLARILSDGLRQGLTTLAESLPVELRPELEALGEALGTELETHITDVVAGVLDDTTAVYTDWWDALIAYFEAPERSPWSDTVKANWQKYGDGIAEVLAGIFLADEREQAGVQPALMAPLAGGTRGREQVAGQLQQWWLRVKAFLEEDVKPWEAAKPNWTEFFEQLVGERGDGERERGVFPALEDAAIDFWEGSDGLEARLKSWEPWNPVVAENWDDFFEGIESVFARLLGDDGLPKWLGEIIRQLGEAAGQMWPAFQPGMQQTYDNVRVSLQAIGQVVNRLGEYLLAEGELVPIDGITSELMVPGIGPTRSVPSVEGRLQYGDILDPTPGGRRFTVAEAGEREAVIPISVQNRRRSLSLVRRVLTELGVGGPDDLPSDQNTAADSAGASTQPQWQADGRGISRIPPFGDALDRLIQQNYLAIAPRADDFMQYLDPSGDESGMFVATGVQRLWGETMAPLLGVLQGFKAQGGAAAKILSGATLNTSLLGQARGEDWLFSLQKVFGQFHFPMEGPITQGFGPASGQYGYLFHSGIDIGGAGLVKAPAAGVITNIQDTGVDGPGGGLGLSVQMAHTPNVSTVYGHLDRLFGIRQPQGVPLKRGTMFARADNSGNSVGDHLHWETWEKGAAQNPLSFVQRLISQVAGATGRAGQAPPWFQDEVLRAINFTGVGADWLAGLMLVAQYESGFNPAAVNPTEVFVNGQSFGHASGAFQTLPSTFAAYAHPRFQNIFSAFDNAVAAINYIRDRHGHPDLLAGVRSVRQGGPWIEYADGGLAGLGGPELAVVGHGPELVIDAAHTRALMEQGIVSGRAGGFVDVAPGLAQAIDSAGGPAGDRLLAGGATTLINQHLAVNARLTAHPQATRIQEEQRLRILVRDELRRARSGG